MHTNGEPDGRDTRFRILLRIGTSTPPRPRGRLPRSVVSSQPAPGTLAERRGITRIPKKRGRERDTESDRDPGTRLRLVNQKTWA
ncbi:hypothetical protein B0H67DRAFT_585454 [Lasiosphaeris hirsuta]|uniref:Uncharacterized protein n=1 Tax=Lasiosphaeris hirsuta TaxID=260670 RepID=A0AA40DPP1_9PEZI|nr:hypothetical protein B0H67DRAFT_585454 [Lasiosphaeris hirsuta]